MKKQLTSQTSLVLLRLSILLAVIWLSGVLVTLAAGEFKLMLSRATGGGQIMHGEGYTVVGAAGQPEAGRLSVGHLRVNGGVIGEIVPQPHHPEILPRVFLPLTWRVYPAWVMLAEVEPNNLFSQANLVPSIPALVTGAHDGAAGGGDVFSLNLEAGRDVEVTLLTGDADGVQLLAYDAAGVEICRDYAEPLQLSFNSTYTGAYFVYVFSDPEAENLDRYTLTLRAGSSLREVYATTAPAMDEEKNTQPPRVEPTP
jgi:hypothetical protein